MQINTQNQMSFGKITRTYPTEVKVVMREIKRAARTNPDWLDVYTGKPFSEENQPSIEHLYAYWQRKEPDVKKMMDNGFNINGLENFFPTGRLGNDERGNKRFSKLVMEKPEILTRLLNEIEKYKTFKSELIDGKVWAQSLLNTLNTNLAGLCSDIKTRALFRPKKHYEKMPDIAA